MRSAPALLLALLLLLLAGCATQPPAFEVAITVDDMPIHGGLPAGMSRLDITEAHIKALQAHGVREAFGFVNANGIEKEPGSEQVLAAWRRAGFPLGNHSFSHMNLDRAPSFEAWQADVIAGEPALAKHMGNGADWHYFRHPNLSAGATPERRDAALAFLHGRGYRIADVSLAFADWDYTDAYLRCRAAGDEAAIAAMTVRYLRGVDEAIARAKADSQQVYGRPIRHVLLTHLGAFSAVTLPAVLARLDAAGARYIRLNEALSDPAYKLPGGGSVIAREAKARGITLAQPLAPAPHDPKTLCR